MKYLIIIFFLPLKLFSQDISGLWTGTLYNDTTKQFIKYELAISEKNGKLTGYSHTIFLIDSVENVGVKLVGIEQTENDVEIVDDKFLFNNYSEAPPKGVKQFSTLRLQHSGDSLMLTGPWHTNRTKKYESLTGEVFLVKKNYLVKNRIVPKLTELGYLNSLSFIPKSADINTEPSVASTQLNKPDINTLPIQKNDSALVALRKDESKTARQISPPLDPGATSVSEAVINKNVDAEKKELVLNSVSTKGVSNILPTEIERSGRRTRDKSTNKTSDQTVSGKAALKKPETTKTPSSLEVATDLKTPPSTSSVSQISSQIVPGSINNPRADIKPIPVIQPAAEITSRKTETIRSVDIMQDSIILSLYDNGEIDGDTVSVVLNDKVIMPRQGLMSRAINKTIYLTPDLGDSLVLVMYAENLGSIPPNTGLLVIRDGEQAIEIRFSGDYKKNSAIILRRKKKP